MVQKDRKTVPEDKEIIQKVKKEALEIIMILEVIITPEIKMIPEVITQEINHFILMNG